MPEDKNELAEAIALAMKKNDGKKPGYKTTEFWLTMAVMVLGALAASGVFDNMQQSDNPWVKLAGVVGMALAAMKYTGSRTKAKTDGDG